MRLSSALLLIGAISAATATSLTTGQVRSRNALKAIIERQGFRLCKPVTTPSCAASCGNGYVTCISWPNCYNPGEGATCCSDGTYCRSGYFCTDAGCCPNGSSLSDCGASNRLSIIPPPPAVPTASAPPPVSTPSAATTTPVSTTTTTPKPIPTPIEIPDDSTTSTSSTSSTSFEDEVTTKPSATPIPLPTPITVSDDATTTSVPLQVTGAAQTMGVGAAQLALGGLGAMFMML